MPILFGASMIFALEILIWSYLETEWPRWSPSLFGKVKASLLEDFWGSLIINYCQINRNKNSNSSFPATVIGPSTPVSSNLILDKTLDIQLKYHWLVWYRTFLPKLLRGFCFFLSRNSNVCLQYCYPRPGKHLDTIIFTLVIWRTRE